MILDNRGHVVIALRGRVWRKVWNQGDYLGTTKAELLDTARLGLE
jgi:hypothetical protein